MFYSHVNYSVTKIKRRTYAIRRQFYSHVNYSVTKMHTLDKDAKSGFTVT